MSRNVQANMGRALSLGAPDLQRVTYKEMMMSGATPTLFRGVVLEVITDIHSITDAFIERMYGVVDNPYFLSLMTANSVIAKIVSSNQANTNWTSVIFPFWSSHIMTPIAPGEQIYIIYEDIAGTDKTIGFWLTRVHGYNTFEDVNYTHLDRRFDPTINRINYTTSESLNRPDATATGTPIPEIFQNGGQTYNTVTLPITTNSVINPYDIIVNNSQAARLLSQEPVPRWNKRPQEFILQGANNSLIMLGEDRNGSIYEKFNYNTGTDVISYDQGTPNQAGAVDIVVGRGRYLQDISINPRTVEDTVLNPPGSKSTAPLIINNSRDYLETDKNPYRNSLESYDNLNEGDPDPIYDAARIYVVQQSYVDENYKLISNVNSGLEYPSGSLANMQPEGQGPYGKSYVVAKADNIRIIGRREPNLGEEENIAGSILLIREGNKNTNELKTDPAEAPTEPDGNMAYIFFDQKGRIQIEAKKIYLGRTIPAGDEDKEPEEIEHPEPYIRFSVYEMTIKALLTQIESIKNHLDSLEQKLGTSFAQAQGYAGTPISSLTALANLKGDTNFSGMSDDIQRETDNINDKYLINVKSTKIFGE